MTLYSAVTAGAAPPEIVFIKKQMIWFGGGLVVMVVCFLFNYKRWSAGPRPFTWRASLLVGVLVFGNYVGGARRWLVLGPVSIQPSELVKIAVIIMLARYYAKTFNDRGLDPAGLCPPVILTPLPFALIVRQPDLGTAMLLVLIAGSMTLFVKIERRTFSFLLATFALRGSVVWFLLKGIRNSGF